MYHVMKFQAPFERLKEYNSSPEIILYKAIITQAIIDATNISDAPRAKTLETDAKKWIFSNSDYFQKICYIAGIEPIANPKELFAWHGLLHSRNHRIV